MNTTFTFLTRATRLFLAVLILVGLFGSGSPASAAGNTIIISDQASCEAVGGYLAGDWSSGSGRCELGDYTVNAGDTLEFSVGAVFDNLTNNGTVNVNGSAGSDYATNNGTINIHSTFRFRYTLHNTSTGIINSWDQLELFGGVPVLNNEGIVTLYSGGELFNDGTVDNQNLIEVKCGAILSGSGSYTGNPLDYEDCTPPSVTVNQASGQADPTNASPINFTAVFSEPVLDFTGTDVVLSGGAGATTVVVTGGPITFNIAVSGMTTGGTVIASIPAGAATDAAGNGSTASVSTDNSVTFVFDTTPPVITANVVGTLGSNGWYTSNVTISWNVVDNESAITSQSGCDPTTITSDTAGTTLTCSATSAGGTNGQSVTIKRDATAPGIAINAPTATTYFLNQAVAANYSCSDAGSGAASCVGTVANGANIDTASLGSKTFTVNAIDNAGNANTASVTYQVIPDFPRTGVLDNFNRANGKVGNNWDGLTGTDFYKIAGNKLDVQSGGPLVWKPTSFGTTQEAFVTLSTIDTKSISQGLLLKVQTGSIPNSGAISVVYDARSKAVRVSALRLGQNGSWTLYANKPATFANRDVLGARVGTDGTVKIYKNGTLIATVTLSTADQAFFNSKGGKIGLWTVGASNAIFDDFGGGTMTP